MRRPVSLEQLVHLSRDPNFDAAVVLAVALGARAAYEVAEDVGVPLPAVWNSLRCLIGTGFVEHLPALGMLQVSRKGQAVARAVYDTRTFTFIPPVPPEAAPEFGGAA